MKRLIPKVQQKIKQVAAKLPSVVALVARLTIGAVFIESGWGKLHNLAKVTEFFKELGIPLAQVQAPFVSGVELVGGIMILVGFWTRLAALPLMGTMVVAILTAKLSDISGPTDIFGFIEFLYIVILLYLFVYGAGKLSVDRDA